MADKSSSMIAAAKATLVGGAIFLIPGFLAWLSSVTCSECPGHWPQRLWPRLGITSFVGGLILHLAAIAVVVFLCFLAGLIARRAEPGACARNWARSCWGHFPATRS